MTQKLKKYLIEAVSIENFKCFSHLKLDDLGAINVFIGDNNVGKSSVLEALLVDENPYQFLRSIRNVFFVKSDIISYDPDKTNYLEPFIKVDSHNKAVTVNIDYKDSKVKNKLSFAVKDWAGLSNIQKQNVVKSGENGNGSKYVSFTKNNKQQIISLYSDLMDNEAIGYMPMVMSKNIYADDLLRFYSEAIIPSKSRKKTLIDDMRSFIPNIEDIEISTTTSLGINALVVRLKDVDAPLPLSMYGEGAIKLFRMLVELAIGIGNKLMIDEIDAGIHFSRFKALWRTILKSAIANEVQLFVSTHNIECLRYLKEVLEEPEFTQTQEVSRCYTLKKVNDGEVKAYKYKFDEFAFAIEQEIEIRGGQL